MFMLWAARQGIVGSTPWNAMVFFTLWLQLTGFSNFAAAALMAVFAGGCALGGLLGGYLGARSAPQTKNSKSPFQDAFTYLRMGVKGSERM